MSKDDQTVGVRLRLVFEPDAAGRERSTCR